MSGKRRALEQLTDRNAYRQDEEDSGDEASAHAQRQASAAVLSRRKILKPKGLFAPKNPSSLAFNSPISNGKGTSTDKNSKIKALNLKFVESINEAKDKNIVADLRPILNKYISFFEEIVGVSSSAATVKPTLFSSFASQSKPVTLPSQTIEGDKPSAFNFLSKNTNEQQEEEPKPTPKAFAFLQQPLQDSNSLSNISTTDKKETKVEVIDEKSGSDSDSDSDDEIKVEGPKFTLEKPPTTKNSVFTFGAKPKPEIEFSDSDSEDDIKVEGPKFTLNNNPTESKSFFGGFKLTDNANGFKFLLPKAAESEEKNKENTPKPVFNFQTPSLTSTTTTATNQSTLSSSEDKEKPSSTSNETGQDKPLFSFGGNAETKQDKPAFAFGGNTETKQDKPAFSFGGNTETNQDKPAFSFGSGSNPTATKEDKPAFSFGSGSNPAATKEDKPAFSFASGSNPTATKEDKPVFSFGAASTQAKPFSLSSTTPSDGKDKPAFSFTGNTEAAPKDSTDSSLNLKPFSFGSTQSGDQSKPAFSFGAASESKPESSPFSFNGTKPASTTSNGEDKPKFNFSSNFNFGGSSSTFNFTPNSASSTAATTTSTTTADEDKVEEHEPSTNFTPVVTLDNEAEVKTGEEDEIVKYTKRSKLSLLANNEYQSKGLGELKILFNSKTSKTRILIRSDGSLRVLLNSLIHKNFKFEKVGKGNMVKFPTINNEGELETYLIQVKTANDGDDLLKAIEEGKS